MDEPEQVSRTWFLQSEPPGMQVILDPLPFRVGRASHLQLVVRFSRLSQEHAEIVREGEGLRVRDLGSRNGTYVNGTRVQESPLGSGDTVRFADAQFRVGALPGLRVAALPGAVDIYWNCSLVGRVEDTSIKTVEGVPGVPPTVRAANLAGRWVPLPGGSSDAFADALEEATELQVVIDGIDGIGLGQIRGCFGWFSLHEDGEAVLRIRR